LKTHLVKKHTPFGRIRRGLSGLPIAAVAAGSGSPTKSALGTGATSVVAAQKLKKPGLIASRQVLIAGDAPVCFEVSSRRCLTWVNRRTHRNRSDGSL
jgi:hypothetical protein